MSKRWRKVLLILVILAIPLIALASVKGRFLKMGIETDGTDVGIARGDLYVVGGDIGCATDRDLIGMEKDKETIRGAAHVTGDDTTSGTKTITGATKLRSTLDVASTSSLAALKYKTYVVNSATSLTLTAADSGKLYTNLDATTTTGLHLPTAAKDLTFSFSDVEAGEGIDLWVIAAEGDTINGGTAGKSYVCTTDTVKHSVKLVAIDPTKWIVIEEVGTWANDNN